jgi:hypothetical protein
MQATLRSESVKARRQRKYIERIMKYMSKCLDSQNKNSVAMACAFYHILSHHIEHGDLRVHEVHLAKLLRDSK